MNEALIVPQGLSIRGRGMHAIGAHQAGDQNCKIQLAENRLNHRERTRLVNHNGDAGAPSCVIMWKLSVEWYITPAVKEQHR
jgi:hypothetical protein